MIIMLSCYTKSNSLLNSGNLPNRESYLSETKAEDSLSQPPFKLGSIKHVYAYKNIIALEESDVKEQVLVRICFWFY